MKLTVLTDNNTTIDNYLLGEPALSFYIEDGSKRILFDTGYSDVCIRNAKTLGIDLGKTDVVAISHGHDDHMGGLVALCSAFDTQGMELVAHPEAFLPRSMEGKSIGSPLTKQQLERSFTFRLSKKPVKISENITFLGEIPERMEKRTAIGVCEKDGKTCPDLLYDDTALCFHARSGIYIITGCSHSGICNIVDYAKEVSGTDRVLGIIGGFHLLHQDERLDKTIAYLKNEHIEALYPCHCVSFFARAAMYQKMPLYEVGSGLVLEWQ